MCCMIDKAEIMHKTWERERKGNKFILKLCIPGVYLIHSSLDPDIANKLKKLFIIHQGNQFKLRRYHCTNAEFSNIKNTNNTIISEGAEQ